MSDLDDGSNFGDLSDDPPWAPPELSTDSRRRRGLLLLLVVALMIVGGAAIAFGVGRSIGGNFEAATKRADQVSAAGSARMARSDWTATVSGCRLGDRGRVETLGTVSLDAAARSGTFEVAVVYRHGDVDVTGAEGVDRINLEAGETVDFEAVGQAIVGRQALPAETDPTCEVVALFRVYGAGSGS